MDTDIIQYLTAKKPKGHLRTLGLKKGQLTPQTVKEPRLFYLLQRWLRTVCPIPYTTIEVNDSIDYKPKKTKHSFWAISNSAQLKTDDGVTHQLLDGKVFPAMTSHSIILGPGRSITVTCWTDPTDPSLTLDAFEAVCVSGEWKIAIQPPGQPRTYLQPHAAKKHKILAASTPPLQPMRGDLNAAQQLLLGALDSQALNTDTNDRASGSIWDSLCDHHRF